MFTQLEQVQSVLDRNRFNQFYSPNKQRHFTWIASLADGNHLSEFDFMTHQEHNFNEINKNQLIQFGLIGNGYYFYLSNPTGKFQINEKTIQIYYKCNGFYYELTNAPSTYYNNIITYKDVSCDVNLLDKNQLNKPVRNDIYQYNFGYKQRLFYSGHNIQFFFQPIVHIPVLDAEPIYMSIKLTCNEDVNGQLLIVRNNVLVSEYEAPLKKFESGELNWIIQ